MGSGEGGAWGVVGSPIAADPLATVRTNRFRILAVHPLAAVLVGSQRFIRSLRFWSVLSGSSARRGSGQFLAVHPLAAVLVSS